MSEVHDTERARLAKIDWIQTVSGKKFSPLSPRAEDVDITDIAHALSMKCRFTGHSPIFYSVAEHCVRASYIASKPYKLAALLHDSAEAYLPDLAAPIKRRFLVQFDSSSDEYDVFSTSEAAVEAAVVKGLGLNHAYAMLLSSDDVKRADLIMLATEARDLMNADRDEWQLIERPYEFGGTTLGALGWSHKEAKQMFLKTYGELR